MQNEERINGLENQVRTLKRIVCSVCCLFVFAMIGGCQSLSTMELPPPVEAVGAWLGRGMPQYNEFTGEMERNSIPLHLQPHD